LAGPMEACGRLRAAHGLRQRRPSLAMRSWASWGPHEPAS
jgi:hypothetical protein